MAKDKFDDILEDEIIKKASAKMSDNDEDDEESEKQHQFILRFKNKAEYKKVQKYAKAKKLTVTSLLLNMLVKKGII